MSSKRRRPKAKAVPIRRRSWRESELEQCEIDYRKGDLLSLAHAIAICANRGIALPEWAAAAYVCGYKNVLNLHADSWDSIFGPAVPKGKHLAALRKRHRESFGVWLAIQRRHENGEPIDDEMFAKVGRELKIGAETLVKSYYDGEKKHGDRILARLMDEALEREQMGTWGRQQLTEALAAIDARQPEKARAIMNAVEKRLKTLV